ncbi:TetR/AcrR family transcriptional regulator [Nonomuraea endophytica]|uniref:AcrR family transcriptional regulator n=1 Tax=Nonomuraea endophytica TaxID=714136 RepID=A0A7W8EJU8_9ACTN|nr:TetR/AcrR family transcriptional regulator [Nonomuraea endophytica]MBB5081911.1 AcrR family transcriptional regulator [Nonomuraea endophytica]
MAPRADAARNAESLISAARELFDEQGSDVALDDIARRAGVGNATLYRHFPTRGDLLVAVYAEEVAELCEQGKTLLHKPSAADALFDWLDCFVVHVATKRALAMGATDGRRTELFDRWHEAMRSAALGLLLRAQQEGAIRSDLDVADLLALTRAVAMTGAGPGHAQRLLRILRHGLQV